MRSCERRTHNQTLLWANEVVETGATEVMGITGKSVFFNVPDFDVVQQMLPEPMHLLDAGFMKNTCGRAFNSGCGPQTKPGYKRTSICTLNDYVR